MVTTSVICDRALRAAAARRRRARRRMPGRACRSDAGSAARPASRPRGRALPMLAAFDEQRVARVDGIVERAVVAQALAGGVARVDHDVLGDADGLRELQPLALPSGQRQRRARVGHRVQVEQIVACRRTPAAARARARGRSSGAGPSSTSAVHSRLKSSSTQREANGSAAIERAIRLDVGERRASACRASGAPPARSSQSLQIAPHTSLPCVSAWIVTRGPGARRFEAPHVRNAGVARLPALEMSGNATSIARHCGAVGDACRSCGEVTRPAAA